MSSTSLNAGSNMDQTVSNDNINEELKQYFLSLIDKKKTEETKPYELKELVRDHHWYIISFQSFCKCDSHTVSNKTYAPYWVLAEVIILPINFF